MTQLYITEHNARLGIEGGGIKISVNDEVVSKVPFESVEGITIIGNGQITTQCIGECLRRGISIQYCSTKGYYFGKVSSTLHVNTGRQREQMRLTEDKGFCVALAKNIMKAKINNQTILLRRYQRNSVQNVEECIGNLISLEKKIDEASTIPEILGLEGSGARTYFKGLSQLIKNPSFRFGGRTRRPPKDKFNSMLSFGYTIIMNDIYNAIEQRGLNPYFGFVHQDREKHPTLSSDLIEEWRPVIVDAVTLSLVNGHEIDDIHFYNDDTTGAIYFTNEGLKIYISKIEKRLDTTMKYLDYIDYPITFRRALDMQALQLCKAIEEKNPDTYKPIIIR